MWQVASKKRTAPPSNNPRKSQKNNNNNRSPHKRLTEAEKAPPETFNCIKLISTNFELFRFHTGIKGPFDQPNRYMPNLLHQYGKHYVKDKIHATQALKYCLYYATDVVCTTDMEHMPTYLEFLKMPLDPDEDEENQIPLLTHVVDILNAHPYLIAQAFATVADLQGSLKNQTSVLSPCPFCNFLSAPMRATCKLVTDLPCDNTHFQQSNRMNSKAGATHFGNRLFNYNAIASHCNQPRYSNAFRFGHPNRETVLLALHNYFGYLINRLRELMPTLITLLDRPLTITERNYIGDIVEEPLPSTDPPTGSQEGLDFQKDKSDQDTAP